MKKLLLAAIAVTFMGSASAATFPTNTTPPWKSYMATGNPSDIVSSPTVATAIGGKVDATSGQSLNQTLQGATLDNKSTWGGTTWATVNNAISCLTTESCIQSTVIKYTPGWAKSSVRTVAVRLTDQVSILDFDPDAGNGSGDATTAYQNAVDAVCAASGTTTPWGSGGDILMPAGVYNISSATYPCNGVHTHGSNNGNVNSGNLDYRGTVIHLTTPANTVSFASGMTTADYGGGIEFDHVGIDGTDMSSSATVFDYSWLQHSSIHDISTYHVTNFFKEVGGASNTIYNVVLFQFRGVGIDFSGGPCTGTLAACDTRADLLRVDHVDMTTDSTTKDTSGNLVYPYTTTCFAYHGLAQSLDVNTSICEQAKFGINAYCDTTAGNNGEACPAFARFYDFEAEDCLTCVNASDVQDWVFVGGYYLGHGSTSTHVINLFNTNYGGNWSTSAVGSYANALRFIGVRVGNSGGSAMYIGTSQVIVSDSQFFSSNVGGSSSGAPNIEVSATGSATTPTQINIHDNILCTASGQQPTGLTQGGVTLQAGVTYSHVTNNLSAACAGPTTTGAVGITDNSGSTTNMISGNG